ncbi:MAG: hypothetical protein ABIO70_12890 [Pseudomonadota bacterium]
MAKVLAERPDLPFLAIETSGDNEVSILSRVSMLVFEAKQKVVRRRAERARPRRTATVAVREETAEVEVEG